MTSNQYIEKGVQTIGQFAEYTKEYGKDTISTSIIYVITIFGVVTLLKTVINNAKSRTKNNEKDEDFIKQLLVDNLKDISKGINKLVDVTNEKNVILIQNLEAVDQIKTDIEKLSNRQDGSFRNMHNRINLMNTEIEGIKANTKMCINK